MTFQQIVLPNPNISCQPGWCLQYVRQTFGAPVVEPTATAGWLNADYRHEDWNFPKDCWVPVWFSLAREPAGHVALLAPDGSVYSTSDDSTIPHHHPSMADLIAYYWRNPLTYLGWSEDISGVRVVENISLNVESVDELTPEQAQQLAYIASPEFKRDIFTGQTDTEKNARAAFIQDFLNTEFPWAGFNGEVPTDGRKTTTLKTDMAWNDTRFAGLSAQVAALREIVTQLSAAQGVTIDYARIAEAVTDELGKRITA